MATKTFNEDQVRVMLQAARYDALLSGYLHLERELPFWLNDASRPPKTTEDLLEIIDGIMADTLVDGHFPDVDITPDTKYK
jgi:hypothetical protein